MHRELFRKYRVLAASREFRISTVVSVVFLGIALVINNFAIHFASERVSNPVTDIILSNTPALPVDNLFIYGTLLVIAVSFVVAFYHPKQIPFAANSVALFFIIRSIFTSLTHLAPFAPHLADDFGASVNRAFFAGDLFFSGHTGLPFLGALMFWYKKPFRYFYMGASIFFAIIVLLGHIHYSIDVASAFFITFGIYHIALWLFPRDHALFVSQE